MSTATAPQSTSTSRISWSNAELLHALTLAARDSCVAYRVDDYAVDVPSASGAGTYRVTWPEGSDLGSSAVLRTAACTCKAAQHNICCKHVAVAVWSKRNGVYAKRAESSQHTYCRGCGAESFAGVTFCIDCCASQKERFGVKQPQGINSPWMVPAQIIPCPAADAIFAGQY